MVTSQFEHVLGHIFIDVGYEYVSVPLFTRMQVLVLET